jgi:hypothetical protein
MCQRAAALQTRPSEAAIYFTGPSVASRTGTPYCIRLELAPFYEYQMSNYR